MELFMACDHFPANGNRWIALGIRPIRKIESTGLPLTISELLPVRRDRVIIVREGGIG
jgi:hypothetical protein